MSINIERGKPEIEKVIKEVEFDYQNNQALILTESDLKCQLYLKLQKKGYCECYETRDVNVTGPLIHTELSWFNKKEKLNIIPDISIMSPKCISIKKSLFGKKLPSKECEFTFSGSILLELKFIKFKCGISKSSVKKIQNDIDKINALYEKLSADRGLDSLPFFCYFVVFTKVNKKCEEVKQLEEEFQYPWGKVIVCSGNVNFNKNVI